MFDFCSFRTAQARQPRGITGLDVLVTIAVVPVLAVLLPALGLSKAFRQCFVYPACQVKEKAQSKPHAHNLD